MIIMSSTIECVSGVRRTACHVDGLCKAFVDLWTGEQCGAPCIGLRIDLHHLSRGVVTSAYCQAHGGTDRARSELAHEWLAAAPDDVGAAGRVIQVGAQGLTTAEAYVLLRPEGPGWLAWLGIGGALVSVTNPYVDQRDKLGKPRTRRVGRRRVPRGAKLFSDKDSAQREAELAWRAQVDARVEQITRSRGGTLAWGRELAPLPAPIVLDASDKSNGWQLALAAPRRSRLGVGAEIIGLRPSGEVL
jgi:hypothetical protein